MNISHPPQVPWEWMIVRTKVGKIKCIKFNPVTETGRLFKTDNDVIDSGFLPTEIFYLLKCGLIYLSDHFRQK